MIINVPAGNGISRINVGRGRAEVSDIDIGYFRGGVPITDGSITPAQQGNNPYNFQTPAEFATRQAAFQLWTLGTWRFGNRPGQGMPRVDLQYFRDRAHVSFYTGAGDPYSNSVVQFFFTHALTDGDVPKIEAG